VSIRGGWMTAHAILWRKGGTPNRSVWRQESVRGLVKNRSGRRVLGDFKQQPRATRASKVWAIDFQFNEIADRHKTKPCNLVDEYTREALAIRAGRSCTGDNAIEVTVRHVAELDGTSVPALRQRPGAHLLGDPRPLQDEAYATSYIAPASPVGEPVR
jgi:hypothetical protein